MTAGRTRRRAVLAGLVAPALGLVAVACGGTDDTGATSTTAMVVTTLTDAGTAVVPSGPCISKMPGEPLTEDEARVRFSATGVCPSYVTVTAGTRVRWTNDHTAAVQVTLVTAGPAAAGPAEAFAGTNPANGGTTVFSRRVAPGETFAHRPERAGTYFFRLDLIPTFLGTLEVR